MTVRQSRERERDLVGLYLDGIGRYPLLSQPDEVRLAKMIEAGKEAGAQLEAELPLDQARAAELRRVKREGLGAFEQFVNSNLRLVVTIAKRYQGGELPMLDLIQEGNIGLMHAVDKFDWRRGYKFSTYSTWWIRQAIGRGIDNTGRTVRLPVHTGDQVRRVQRARASLEGRLGRTPTAAEVAENLGMPERQVMRLLSLVMEPVSLSSPIGSDGDNNLGDVVPDESSPTPFDEVAEHLLGAELAKLLSQLGERERLILSLRFGLDRGEPRTLDEVGAEMNLTRERIRQIERGALAKLRLPAREAAARELLAS